MADTYASRVPEPALIRGAVVAITSVIAVVTGQAIDIGWLEGALNVYAAVSPLVAGYLIRRVVSPVGRHSLDR